MNLFQFCLFIIFISFCQISKGQEKSIKLVQSQQILFVGVPNYVEIIPKSTSDLFVIVQNDTFECTENKCEIHIRKNTSKTKVKIVERKGQSFSVLSEEIFKVKSLPPPSVYFPPYPKKNTFTVQEIIRFQGIHASILNWDYDLRTRIISFEIINMASGGILSSSSPKFSAEQIEYIKSIESGGYLIINNITVKTPIGVKNIGSKIFEIK